MHRILTAPFVTPSLLGLLIGSYLTVVVGSREERKLGAPSRGVFGVDSSCVVLLYFLTRQDLHRALYRESQVFGPKPAPNVREQPRLHITDRSSQCDADPSDAGALLDWPDGTVSSVAVWGRRASKNCFLPTTGLLVVDACHPVRPSSQRTTEVPFVWRFSSLWGLSSQCFVRQVVVLSGPGLVLSAGTGWIFCTAGWHHV